MAKARYYDDEEEGLAAETSHPRFVALFPDDRYYDVGEDFSPFGNDDGADVLAFLEEWYQEGGKDAAIMSFLEDTLAQWDFGVPDGMMRADMPLLAAWLAEEDMHATYLGSECRGVIATALGQLKITGKILPSLRLEALAAIDCSLRLNTSARSRHPDWKHADDEVTYLEEVRTALAQLQDENQ